MESKDALNFAFVAVVLVVMVTLVACNKSEDTSLDVSDGGFSDFSPTGSAITWVSCSDSDGDSPNIYGSVTYTYVGNDGVSRTRTSNDVCSGSSVREYTCRGNTATSSLVFCSSGCSAGACVVPPSSPAPSSSMTTSFVQATPADITSGASAAVICTNAGYTGCLAGGRNTSIVPYGPADTACSGSSWGGPSATVYDYRLVGCDVAPRTECYLNSTGTGYRLASPAVVNALCTR
ncbi:hypothetical protein HYU19_03840 [Candidatus Woesearchaeota archaeon]|nr:hypothetical protein [Candidatus Woesearchaeota archaeon]